MRVQKAMNIINKQIVMILVVLAVASPPLSRAASIDDPLLLNMILNEFEGDDSGDHLRLANVFDRGSGQRLHQYPAKHLLGDRDADHRRLWRHLSPNRSGPVSSGADHGDRFWNDSRADRNCDR